MEGVEVREGMEEAARGEGEDVTGRAAAAATTAEEEEVLVARLKTSRGERDSWCGGGGCSSSCPGPEVGTPAGTAGPAVPSAARMISTASSTLCLSESSLARRRRSWAGVSSSNIPVILPARLGLSDWTRG